MITRMAPTATSNRIAVHQGVVYLGGLGAPDCTADMYGQTRQILERVDAFLAEAGSDKDHLLRATIFISDPALKAEMNRAWNEWVEQAQKPARATIAVGDMGGGMLVEIEITAALAAA